MIKNRDMKITKKLTDKVGICSYDDIKRHRKYEWTTPLFQTLLDILTGDLETISDKQEKWKVTNTSLYIREIDIVNSRRELYNFLSNLDLGYKWEDGSRGLYEYILNFGENVDEIDYVKFEKTT